MAKKKKEEVVEKTTNEPKGKETKGDVTKVKKKMKMKPIVEEQTITKVDLSEPPKEKENEQPVDNKETEDVQEKAVEETINKEEVVEQTTEENVETPVLEEVTNEETIDQEVGEIVEKAEEAITESIETGEPLPENVQKLLDFIEDTGGDLHDYVNLNKDYSKMDNHTLLQEHYKKSKPHLSNEEIEFLMEDQFSYDEEVDDEREIKRKKLALKEQVANAKTQLEENKSKYYDEIKSGSKLTKEQQEAIDFYQKSVEKQKWEEGVAEKFVNKTNRFFGDKFKGFEYNVGEKRFRFNVNDVNKTKETQSDINNFIGKFLDKDYNMVDEAGYHKGLFTAMNPDAIANHFYEQGKADAMKDSVAKAKNIDMAPRQEFGENLNQSGVKVRALGDTTPDFKFKIKNK